jgi:hypothetical protein
MMCFPAFSKPCNEKSDTNAYDRCNPANRAGDEIETSSAIAIGSRNGAFSVSFHPILSKPC